MQKSKIRLRNQRTIPAPILSSGPFQGQFGSSPCVSAPDYDYLQLAGGRFYRHLPMSHSTERNMSSVQQTIASKEKEHTVTYADGPQQREEDQKLAASNNCHYHLFTGTGHEITPCKLQAEEWRLIAGAAYGLEMTEPTRILLLYL